MLFEVFIACMVASATFTRAQVCNDTDVCNETHACDLTYRNHPSSGECKMECDTHEDCEVLEQDLYAFYCKISNRTTGLKVCEPCYTCEPYVEGLNDAYDGACPRRCGINDHWPSTTFRGCLQHEDCSPLQTGEETEAYYCGISSSFTDSQIGRWTCKKCTWCVNASDTTTTYDCYWKPFDGMLPEKCNPQCLTDDDCPEFDGINGVEKQYCKPVYTITDGYQLNHCVPCHSCFYETHCRDRCADSRRFEIRSSSSYLAPWLFPSVMPIAAILSICAST